MPYGFFYFAGESVLRRTSDAMTPRERQAGRFLYDDIDHFRRRYPLHMDIRRFVEREHEAYRRQSSLPNTDDNNNETEFYWSTGPWCADCCCYHNPHEKCLPPVRARHDDDWAIPAAAIVDSDCVEHRPTAAQSNRTVVFANRPLNPPPAAACAALTLAREAAPETGMDSSMTSLPPALPSTSIVPPSPSLYAAELHAPLATAIDAAVADGKLPSLRSVVDLVALYMRSHTSPTSSADIHQIHEFITGLFPPAHHVFAETVALAIQEIVRDNSVLHDVIHRLRLDIANRDRQIKQLSAGSQPAASVSASNAGIDVCSSDRKFD
jgi:hypothetical protein